MRLPLLAEICFALGTRTAGVTLALVTACGPRANTPAGEAATAPSSRNSTATTAATASAMSNAVGSSPTSACGGLEHDVITAMKVDSTSVNGQSRGAHERLFTFAGRAAQETCEAEAWSAEQISCLRAHGVPHCGPSRRSDSFTARREPRAHQSRARDELTAMATLGV